MKTFVFLPIVLSALALAPSTRSQTSPVYQEIAYQGRLLMNQLPAQGRFDIQASLYATESDNVPVHTVEIPEVSVANGLFNVRLEMNAGWFNPQPDPPGFLEFAVRRSTDGGPTAPYTLLRPRQRLSATPYAQSAARALTAQAIESGSNRPVTLSVQGEPGLRLEPTLPGLAPNVIAGHSGNAATPNVVGAVIMGGGAPGAANFVGASFGTVAGGVGNSVGSFLPPPPLPPGSCPNPTGQGATVGGGGGNTATGDYATTSGGQFNATPGSWGTTAGGQSNLTAACWSVISGGLKNWIQIASTYGVISGGDRNLIESNSPNATVSGGASNWIRRQSPYGTIAGGLRNTLDPSTESSAISGGRDNTIQTNSLWSTITGGRQNRIGVGADGAVAGGVFDVIDAGADSATISGGYSNRVSSVTATVGGGEGNYIRTGSGASTIAGGSLNLIDQQSYFAAVGGGRENAIRSNAVYSTIGGGGNNRIEARSHWTTIGGGYFNTITPDTLFATIPGGEHVLADRYGQMGYAHGAFGTESGSAQTSIMVPFGSGTNTNVVELFLNGPGGSRRMVLRPGATWTFDILVTARSNGGQSAGYTIRGVIENVGGITSFVGVPMVTAQGEDVATWNAYVEADNANDALVIKAVGGLNTSVRWVATVRTVEVVF